MADVSFGAQLDHPPSDGVTSLRFSPSSDLLLASSWDGVREADFVTLPMHFFASRVDVLPCRMSLSTDGLSSCCPDRQRGFMMEQETFSEAATLMERLFWMQLFRRNRPCSRAAWIKQ